MKYKYLLICLAILLGTFFSYNIYSQGLYSRDYSTIRVIDLSDSQIMQFISQLKSIGISDNNIEKTLIEKGMNIEEVTKLVQRSLKLNLIKMEDQLNSKIDSLSSVPRDSVTFRLIEDAMTILKSRIFGEDIFSDKNTFTFQPNTNLAVPPNYQLGPGDELIIDVYGNSEVSHTKKITVDGLINIPLVGVLTVGGLPLDQARARIEKSLSSVYPGISLGNTFVRVSVGNIRTINVIITGNVFKPGTYSLSSVSSVFNALYYSGGPTENGSFRLIEVIRGGKKIATIDVYQFLLGGELNNNITLQDNDVILVPTFQRRIEIIGEIKTPGFFELIDGENFNNVLKYSGGFSDQAFKDRIKIYSNTNKEKKIVELTSSEFNSYHLKSGDKLFIDAILDRFENRVFIEGAVFRPGEFQLESEMTLSQLINKAEGLKEDAFLNKIQILRKGSNLQNQLISIDLSKIISGEFSDIKLENEDLIKIYSIFDLKEEYFIRVEGEAARPGEIPYFEGMTLEDAILKSGGFRGNATNQRIEVARRVLNSDQFSSSALTSEVFTLEVSPDLKSTAKEFYLKPFDVVVIRSSEGYNNQEFVKIEGEVLYPGTYAISRKDERISDLVKRAGGFSIWAYPEGASLRRINKNSIGNHPLDKLQNKQPSNPNFSNSLDENSENLNGESNENVKNDFKDNNNQTILSNDYLGIELSKIIENPGTSIDMFLQEGDVLFVPKELQTVKISGEVLFPSTTQYKSNLSLKNYIRQAGGFNEFSKKDGAFVKYANGEVKNSKKILFFPVYPRIEPGAEIFVPKGRIKEPFNLNQLVGITSSLVTIYLLINSLQ